jgi:hypothetical protein
MHSENLPTIYFFGLHAFMFRNIEYNRVCFKTNPGLHHEPLKIAIERLAQVMPENLTWDPSCGEGSFCLLASSVAAGTYVLPYQEEK